MCVFRKKRLKTLYAVMHERITAQRELRGNGKELLKAKDQVFYKLPLQCLLILEARTHWLGHSGWAKGCI